MDWITGKKGPDTVKVRVGSEGTTVAGKIAKCKSLEVEKKSLLFRLKRGK